MTYLPEVTCRCGATCTGAWTAEYDATTGQYEPTCTTCKDHHND